MRPKTENPTKLVGEQLVPPSVIDMTALTDLSALEVLDMTTEKDLSAPEGVDMTMEKDLSVPEVVDMTMEKDLSAPEVVDMTIEKDLSAPEVVDMTMEKDLSAPEAVDMTMEKDLSAPEVVDMTTETDSPAAPERKSESVKPKIVGAGITVPSAADIAAAGPSGVGGRPARSGVPIADSPSNRRPRSKPPPGLASLAALPPSVSAMAGLPLAEDSYDEISIIGAGAYGTVYKGREKNNPEEKLVALKKLRMQLSDDGVPVDALREISLLRHLEKYNHPNIVKLLDVCHGRVERTSKLSLILVFEYIEQDLESFMRKCPSPGLGQDLIKQIMHQIMCGIDFLHSHRVVHRDMKPQNILVSRNRVVKIADFGLAKVYDFYSRLTTAVVTLWYRSPEVLLSNSYATSVDIWSCGCIFAELFKLKPLFEGLTEGDQLQRIFNIIGKPTEEEWPDDVSLLPSNFRDYPPLQIEQVVPELTPDAADLLKRMITFLPGNRIGAREALTHPYFSGMAAPSITTLRHEITRQTLCRTAAFANRNSWAALSSRAASTLAQRARELLRRPKPCELIGSSVPKKRSNDENNPNAGNSAPDRSHIRPPNKSPPSKGPNRMEE